MIHPDMATMLGFVVTDAAVDPEDLQSVLEDVNARTFNAITVDGDMSTNDTLILQAPDKVQQYRHSHQSGLNLWPECTRLSGVSPCDCPRW